MSASSTIIFNLQDHPEFILVDEKIPKWLATAQAAIKMLAKDLQLPVRAILQQLKINATDVNFDLEDEEFVEYDD